MNQTLATRGEGLFLLPPSTLQLVRQRAQGRHDSRVKLATDPQWWRVDSPDHPGFELLDQHGKEQVVAQAHGDEHYPDYSHLKYDIGNEPLLRSIEVDGLEVGFITRNYYGAAVLNTDLLAMIDIDVRTDDCATWDPRIHGPSAPRYPVSEVELRNALRELTRGRFGRAIDYFETTDSPAFRQLVACHWPDERLIGDDPIPAGVDVSVAVFETHNGYRLVLDKPLVITEENEREVSSLMRFLYADPDYRQIACRQKLWRSRLTRKPWRKEEPKGQPLRFLFQMSGGDVSYERLSVSDPLLAPLFEVLMADNSDLHIDD